MLQFYTLILHMSIYQQVRDLEAIGYTWWFLMEDRHSDGLNVS